MHTRMEPHVAVDARSYGEAPNGEAVAAFLAAGIGSFAMGLFVILSETGVFAPPTLYEPAGGVSGRTTFAVAAWLIAWGVLHARWRGKEIATERPFMLSLTLIVLGLVLTFPLVWGLL